MIVVNSVTTDPLRATITLIWPSVKMSLTPLLYYIMAKQSLQQSLLYVRKFPQVQLIRQHKIS